MLNIIATRFCRSYDQTIVYHFQIDSRGRVTIRVYRREQLLRGLIAIIPAKNLDLAIKTIRVSGDVYLKRLKNDWRQAPRLWTDRSQMIRFLEPGEKPEDRCYIIEFSAVREWPKGRPFKYYGVYKIKKSLLLRQLRGLNAKYRAYCRKNK